MDDETLEALKGSIAKWERNAVAETPFEYGTGGYNCPLCVLFNEPYDHPETEDEDEDIDIDPDNMPCTKCPVMQKTGQRYCADTPYMDAHKARYEWRQYVSNYVYPDPANIDEPKHSPEYNEFKKRAQECAVKEVEFLKSLLPENQDV